MFPNMQAKYLTFTKITYSFILKISNLFSNAGGLNAVMKFTLLFAAH